MPSWKAYSPWTISLHITLTTSHIKFPESKVSRIMSTIITHSCSRLKSINMFLSYKDSIMFYLTRIHIDTISLNRIRISLILQLLYHLNLFTNMFCSTRSDIKWIQFEKTTIFVK